MTNAYWNNNGNHEDKLPLLYAEIAKHDGRIRGVENAKLERLRKMNNTYYRMFNDGVSGDVGIRKAVISYFGSDVFWHMRRYAVSFQEEEINKVFAIVEPIMDAAILAAFEEQKELINSHG